MTPESERVVERIRKLLALSASSNPNEAALAAEKAVELAQRYNLDLAQIDGVGSDPYVERTCDVGGASQWRWLLMSAVARANFCRALRRRVLTAARVGVTAERVSKRIETVDGD